ncbi:RHS repeat-associated core domain-containing protein [Pseudomonas sp. NBRC 111124]|uniref:RHS repeat-associated core domain-containing protein n=1 Tax=Pseudomonas sp. NBRC 111124 TaxID=1661039 RepID=UPI0009E787E4|nr:RHS repeat-associated core domain-containing protein [Pseudomonas sp. NBRC 111124]
MKARLFYQMNHLQQVLRDGQNCCILRVKNSAIAELHETTVPIRRLLLAIDSMRSIVRTQDASIRQVLSYSPYGHLPRSGQDIPILAFNGEKLDKSTERYFLGIGHRTYSPGVMRFCSADAASPFLQGGLNSYSYCSGDPINYQDPSAQYRIPLQRIASHQPPRYSGNPTLNQSRRLIHRARVRNLRAEQARALATDAYEASLRSNQNAEQFQRRAAVSTNPQRQIRHVASASQDMARAAEFLEVAEQHLRREEHHLEHAHRLNNENYQLLTSQAENVPPALAQPPQPQPFQTNNTPPLQAQNIGIRRPHVT